MVVRRYGRARKGKRAYGEKPYQRGKNVSLIGAIALRGLITIANLLGATDAVTFEAFMVRYLIPNLWEGAVVVMDNASIHKEQYLRPLLSKVGVSLEFLSPYSPDFLPIENFCSKLKWIITSIKPRKYKDLIEAITKACEQISLKDIHNWFAHCCYCEHSVDEAKVT